MQLRLLAFFGSAALLQSCAPAPPPPPPPPRLLSIIEPRPAPLAAPLGWEIHKVILLATYSSVKQGKYDIMLFCDGREHLALYYILPPDAPLYRMLSLSSGPLSTTLPATAYYDRATPPPTSSDPGPIVGVYVNTIVAIADPVIARFLNTGELMIAAGMHSLRLDARPEDLPRFAAEMRSCPRVGS